MCGELGNNSFESTLEPVEILLPEEQKLIQIVAGHSFTIGVCIPLHGEKAGEKSAEKRKSRVIDAVTFSDDENGNDSRENTGTASFAKPAGTSRQIELTQSGKQTEVQRFEALKPQQSSENSSKMETNENRMVTPKRRAAPSAFGFNTAEIVQQKERMRSSGSALVGMTSTFAVRKSTAFTPVIERKAAVEDVNGDDICFQSRAQRAAALEKQFQSILKK